MNLRTTIVLLALAAVGGAAWWFGPQVAPHLGLTPRVANPNGAGSPDVLENQLTRDKIHRIKVQAGDKQVILEKGGGGKWALPGKWPTRKGEAEELIDLITSLRTRFQVIPITASDMDLTPFGLAPSQHPVKVEVKAEGDKTITLEFGEPRQPEGGPFATPTYVQVNDKPEVVRLGPDILPILKRPSEYYQRRQLFPEVERVKFVESRPASPFGPTPEGAAGPVQIPRARTITLEGPQGKVVLKSDAKPAPAGAEQTVVRMDPLQLAEQWEIVEPVKDRAEPEKLKALLSAVPNLWVESFAPQDDAALLAKSLVTSAYGVDDLSEWLRLGAENKPQEWALKHTGLQHPEYKLTVTPPGGDPVTLAIGRISDVKERPGTPTPPPRPGMPPMPPVPVREEYRYARLEGQPIIFEVRADRLNDLFGPAATLRDEKLARFSARDVTRVEIKQPAAAIVLVKEKDDKKIDKWRVERPMQALAESDKITELLDKLGGLEARDKDVIDQPNLKDAGFEPAPAVQVSLTLEEEMPGPGDEKTKRSRSVSFAFGKIDAAAKKVNVRAAGRARVNLVDESAIKLAERPALAYRGRRVLDFDASQVARVEVKRPSESFTLQQVNADWKLTAPVAVVADKTKAANLADDLGRLEAVEYVNDAPKPDDLTKAGLDKPELTATVAFTDPAKKPQTLLVGKQREGKPEYFAKLADGVSVFVIRKDLRDRLEQGSLDYRVTQLWTLTPDDITLLQVDRGTESYELKREGFNWKIVKPFEAPVGAGQVLPMVDALAMLKLQGYEAHTAANLAPFGLDKPRAKLSFTAAEKGKEGVAEAPRERILLVGKTVAGKPEAYAKLADEPAIFRVAESVVLNTNKPALDLLDRQLLTLDSRRISRIERNGPDTLTALREGNVWKIQSGNVSFAADPPTMNAVLKSWEFLQAEKFAAYGAKVKWEEYGLNPPAATMTVTLGGELPGGKPEKHTLKLGKPADGGARFARVDDGPGVAVISAVTAKELARGHLDFADKSLLSVDEAGIQSIRRQMKDNDLEITRAGGWKIMKPSEQKADDAFMDDFARQLATLRAEKVAAFAPGDLKPFGLDSPAAVVTIAAEKDGKPAPHVLRIGAPADPKAPDGERFVAVEGSKVVGVLSRADARKLLAAPITFRDRALVKRLPEPDKVTLERGERIGDKKAVFTKAEGTWKMTAPVPAEAEHADLEEFVNALFKLRADELVAEKPSAQKLKDYGLDKPEATWRFFSGDKEVLALVVGKRDSTDQRVYAKLGGGDVVFLLGPPVTAQAVAEYRKRALWTGFDAAQVEVLTLGGEGGPAVLRKSNGTWQLDGKPEAKVKQEAVTEVLAALANLKAERYVRDKDAPLDLYGLSKPHRTIIARTTAGQTQELHLGNREGGGKRAYAALPGHTEVFVLSEADTAKLDRDVKSLMEK